MNNSSGVLVGILIVVVILVVAWVAYSQGFFNAKQDEQNPKSVEIKLTGPSDNSTAK